MNLWKSFAGMVRLRISTASVANLITKINNAGIDLIDVVSTDDLTIEATVLRKDIYSLKEIAEKNGETVKTVNKTGLYWIGQHIKQRKLLILVIALIMLLTVFLPTRILFVRVEGNAQIPSNYIIEVADSSGVTFGASRREVRSEKIKNMLLEKIPELQWTGINTYGCVAVISVRERSITNTIDKPGNVCNIIASQDGIIEQCTVLRGSSMCKVGQSVNKGQVLISGYIDCGRYIKAVKAEAEVYARTLRKLKAITPTERCVRGNVTESKTLYSLLFGKKLIKLSQDSGISPSGCVKMYETRYLTLPGGFRLPLALVIEQHHNYASQTECTVETDSCQWMYDFSEKYLLNHMIAGKIISSDLDINSADGYLTLQGRYICSELIGQVKSEEIIRYDGKTD